MRFARHQTQERAKIFAFFLSTKVANPFGKKGYDRAVYNYAIHSLMTTVKDEMEKQKIDKICNSKIHLEFPGMYNSSIYEIIGSFNGTALRKIKQ